MKLPVIAFTHIVQGGTDATLGRHRMRAGREHLADTGGFQPACGHAKGRTQAGATGANDNNVILMVSYFI